MDANYFGKLTLDMLSFAPPWKQSKKLYLNGIDWEYEKTTDKGINIFKMIVPGNSDANIFLFQVYFNDDDVFEYYLSPESIDSSTGETVYPVFYIGHNALDVAKGYSHIEMYMNIKEEE